MSDRKNRVWFNDFKFGEKLQWMPFLTRSTGGSLLELLSSDNPPDYKWSVSHPHDPWKWRLWNQECLVLVTFITLQHCTAQSSSSDTVVTRDNIHSSVFIVSQSIIWFCYCGLVIAIDLKKAPNACRLSWSGTVCVCVWVTICAV